MKVGCKSFAGSVVNVGIQGQVSGCKCSVEGVGGGDKEDV